MDEKKMMLRLTLFVLLFSLPFFSYADAAQDESDVYTVFPYKMTKVVKITVITPTRPDANDGNEDCSTFVITPKTAKYFFNHAHPISERERTHERIFSYCYARGTVKFANGDEATWNIVRGGTGLITPVRGKFKGKVISLYCKKCEDWGL